MRGALDKASFPSENRPFVVITGRSNSGKSSLINKLTKAKHLARVSKLPGRTTEINFFDIGGRYFLIDLPGYGYSHSSKEEWVPAIEDLFRDDRTKLVLLLIDIRRDPNEHDIMLFDMTRHFERHLQIVLTKRDKVGRTEFSKIMSGWKKSIQESMAAAPIVTSSKTGEGLDTLEAIIEAHTRVEGKK